MGFLLCVREITHRYNTMSTCVLNISVSAPSECMPMPLLDFLPPTAAPPVESMVGKNKRIYENFEAAVCVRKIYVEGELCVCDASEVCVWWCATDPQ